jgi:chromosome segregation ATPase
VAPKKASATEIVKPQTLDRQAKGTLGVLVQDLGEFKMQRNQNEHHLGVWTSRLQAYAEQLRHANPLHHENDDDAPVREAVEGANKILTEAIEKTDQEIDRYEMILGKNMIWLVPTPSQIKWTTAVNEIGQKIKVLFIGPDSLDTKIVKNALAAKLELLGKVEDLQANQNTLETKLQELRVAADKSKAKFQRLEHERETLEDANSNLESQAADHPEVKDLQRQLQRMKVQLCAAEQAREASAKVKQEALQERFAAQSNLGFVRLEAESASEGVQSHAESREQLREKLAAMTESRNEAKARADIFEASYDTTNRLVTTLNENLREEKERVVKSNDAVAAEKERCSQLLLSLQTG